MIRVIYEREQYRVTTRGHACYGAYGEDIICSAVSVLMLTLLRMGNRLQASGKAVCGGRLESGLGNVWCRPAQGCEETVRTVMDTVAAGLELLGEEFPDYVCYELRKQRKENV